MKVLVISDSHGRHELLRKAIGQEAPIDMLIHAGDVEGDLERILGPKREYEIHAVSGNMDWGDYIGERDESSGIWYMLTGCEYLYMDEHGQCITLVAKTTDSPQEDKKKITRINLLVPRFLIRNEIGVIE